MAVTVDAIHDDGRRARMSRARFDAVQGNGWREATPADDAPKAKRQQAAVAPLVSDDEIKAATRRARTTPSAPADPTTTESERGDEG